MKDLELINKSALEYKWSVKDRVKDICNPLNTLFGFNLVSHGKFFKNGTYLHVCNNIKWGQYLISNSKSNGNGFFNSEIRKAPLEKLYICMTPSLVPKDEILSPLYHEFNTWHALVIYLRHIDWVEGWTFGVPRDCPGIINVYLNEIETIKSFIKYFQNEASDIIDPTNKKKLAVLIEPDNVIDAIQSTPPVNLCNLFLREKDFRNFAINGEKISLSKREFECLTLLSQGKTVKEIAIDLQLSPRTVESHLNGIKDKTNCRYKTDLARLYHTSIVGFQKYYERSYRKE